MAHFKAEHAQDEQEAHSDAWADTMNDRPTDPSSWPGQASPEAVRLADRLREEYPRFQYTFVNFIADHMADMSRQFRGDLQQMLVLAIIGQVYLNAVLRGTEEQRTGPHPKAWIGASRIADVTGIPRETVRRKLKILERAGWIVRSDDGSWQIRIEDGRAAARKDLSDLDERQIARAARLLSALRDIR